MTPAERDDMRARVADHLIRIERLFAPGAKLTIVIRQPHLPGDTGVLVTNEVGDKGIEAAIAEIRKLMATGEDA